MSEQTSNIEVDTTREVWHLASEADRSMKAALFSVQISAEGVGVRALELRRDVRRAAQDHSALVAFLHSGAWHWPPPREETTDEAVHSNIAASAGAFLMNSSTAKRIEAHLHLEDLGGPEEALFLDRYTSWLQEPREPRYEFSNYAENDADVVRWHIQALANFYAIQFEEPLR